MHKELALLATFVAIFTFVAFGAQAMPASKLKGANNSSEQITLVAGGCGRGWHRGRTDIAATIKKLSLKGFRP